MLRDCPHVNILWNFPVNRFYSKGVGWGSLGAGGGGVVVGGGYMHPVSLRSSISGATREVLASRSSAAIFVSQSQSPHECRCCESLGNGIFFRSVLRTSDLPRLLLYRLMCVCMTCWGVDGFDRPIIIGGGGAGKEGPNGRFGWSGGGAGDKGRGCLPPPREGNLNEDFFVRVSIRRRCVIIYCCDRFVVLRNPNQKRHINVIVVQTFSHALRASLLMQVTRAYQTSVKSGSKFHARAFWSFFFTIDTFTPKQRLLLFTTHKSLQNYSEAI